MKRLWLYILVAAIIICCLGLVEGWLWVWHLGGIALAPTSRDDTVYYQLMTSGQVCLQNLTSTLAEGGCRLWPLWLIGGWLSFGVPGLGMLVLRLVIMAGLGVTIWYGVRVWTAQTGLNQVRLRNWLTGFLVLSPLPLVLVTSYALVVPELTLPGSLLYSPSNLLSWWLYVLVGGGLYLYRTRPAAWPWLGLLAGAWGLHHAYYVPYVLTLFGGWLLLNRRQARQHLWQAVSLLAPLILIAGYYLWLSQASPFFAFHLTSNHTRHYPWMRWWLLLAVAVALIIIWLGRRALRSRASLRVSRFMYLWLGLSVAWQLVPQFTERRLMLILALPLAIVLTELVVASATALKRTRPYLLVIFITNGLLLMGLMIANASIWASDATQAYVVTRSDQAFADKLKALGPGRRYVADETATSRYLWQGQIIIVNAHHHLSPDFGYWAKNLTSLEKNQLSCSAFSRGTSEKFVEGVILHNKISQLLLNRLSNCGWNAQLQDDQWSLMVPR